MLSAVIQKMEERFRKEGVMAHMHHKLALLPPDQLQGEHDRQPGSLVCWPPCGGHQKLAGCPDQQLVVVHHTIQHHNQNCLLCIAELLLVTHCTFPVPGQMGLAT